MPDPNDPLPLLHRRHRTQLRSPWCNKGGKVRPWKIPRVAAFSLHSAAVGKSPIDNSLQSDLDSIPNLSAFTVPTKVTAILLFLVIQACAPVTGTQVHEGHGTSLPQSLAVLPFKATGTSGAVDAGVLGSLQRDLVKHLRNSGHFRDVIPASDGGITDASVQCTVTQFDSSARRVVILTEVAQSPDNKVLRRMVTRSDLASVIWPIDYFIGLGPLWRSAIVDIADGLSR